ncbi:sugar 3,4-ketoisomerase [Aestuariivivens insulae]|uniref:sugar 3,4-ketoisomerase n=1 Tax=Aestuariivivens insulae TaxID=1621988 RepID=UPI001F58F913|nr:FdtA/QdtA family cupin domain-containing protein [Aestuariivivens insulae]
MKTINDIQIVDLPKICDIRGNISVIENNTLPYKVERVYYLFDVPSSARRGGHSHIKQSEFLIAVSGSFNVLLKDGLNETIVTLNKPDKGLLIPNGIWRELENFSSGAVCLVLASDVYSEDDYIRDYNKFVALKTK